MSKNLNDSQDVDQEAQRILRLAKASAIKARLELVRQKEILPAREFSEALGISLGALNREVKAYRLFAMELAGETYYPAFYLHRPPDRMKIKRACKALGDLDGWEKWRFFTTPKGSVAGRTPIQALEGDEALQAAIASAVGFAER
ncbi:hypothetical protein [Thiobacillus denitrificans]|uniref:hypothetical protein n=1 Tax=Thiobacillus denitrificans TaxID=36861 RepID=UPI00035E6AE5|nr:hypothetical protein [Thiobacillus denitrificans]